LHLGPCSRDEDAVCCCVAIATGEVSKRADNGRGEEEATAGETTNKEEGDLDWSLDDCKSCL